ncbi:LysR family transcriptional regulator [Opitutaceae bacterium TAV5]|nr:LysR family transcriptional regulator [Opitutaceae bacterium TAV5]
MNDPIDSRKLQIFLCLARKGSLKAAAPELCLTISAVSHAISSLEANLGVQLFHRSGKGLVLTEKGEYLYRTAIPVVARMNNIRSALAGEQHADRAFLRVAAGFNFLSYIVPDIVREFNECFPRGNISIRASERDVSLQLLRDREVDAAIMVEPPEDGPDFTYHKLFDDELKLLMHARNAQAGLEVVPLRSLASKTLIVARAHSHTNKALQLQLNRKGIEFRECIEVGSTAAILEMVKLGQGVAMLPDWVVRNVPSSSGVVTRPVEGLRLNRTWAFVCAKWTLPNLALRTFRRLCQQAVTGLTEEAPPSLVNMG